MPGVTANKGLLALWWDRNLDPHGTSERFHVDHVKWIEMGHGNRLPYTRGRGPANQASALNQKKIATLLYPHHLAVGRFKPPSS